jgi:hypothetical protein
MISTDFGLNLPEDLLFVSVLALLTMLISLPIDIFLTLIMESYAAQRPQFEDIGLNPNNWLGAEKPSLIVRLHMLTMIVLPPVLSGV